jgi:hypothetical protein
MTIEIQMKIEIQSCDNLELVCRLNLIQMKLGIQMMIQIHKLNQIEIQKKIQIRKLNQIEIQTKIEIQNYANS